MDTQKRFDLIARNTEEILTEEDLHSFLEQGMRLKHYIGFEISGFIHLGTGLASMLKVRDFQEAGVDCSVFLADWHSWINDKLGGDLETIKKIAGGYFKEGMKASLQCVGGDESKLKFVLGSDLYHNNDGYWQTFVDISKNTNLARVLRSVTILGRKEGESIDFAKLLYPNMQVADIFIQNITLAHSGLDQRKAHVIAREVASHLKVKPLIDSKKRKISPVAAHHHLLLGLGKPPVWPVPPDQLKEMWLSLKMSKSKPDSCIFIHDTKEEIERKLKNAFCPEGEVYLNPVMDWAKHLLFPVLGKIKVERDRKFGGDVCYDSFLTLEKDFRDKKLHPADLKMAVGTSLIRLLEPARKHFEKPKIKEMKKELEQLKITR